MTHKHSNPRRPSRPWLALALAALVGWPVAAAAPAGATAAPATTGSVAEGPASLEAANGKVNGDLTSIHYEHATEHADDAIDFEPGGRVTIPFSPRAGDNWRVDGRAPRALPAGHATGAQMRAAPANAIWSAGPPADLAVPDHAAANELTTTVEPASYATASSDDEVAAAPVGSNGLRREVFGFLPYWEVSDTSTTLDWRTLSTVAYFSVGCTSSGGLLKENADGSTSTGWGGWTSSKMTSIINAAHQNNTRVVLTISCFAWSSAGATRQASVLGSATNRTKLAKAAAAAVRDRGADGINLDFEPIVAGYADEFTALVRAVRTELNNVAPGYQLTFDTLGSIGNQPIADATASGAADAVFIMGYDYRTASSSVAGSISPLTGPRYDLTDTVKAYMAKVSPSKIILGVPYYGRAWSTSSDSLNASTLSQAKYGASASPTYGQAVDLVTQHGRRWDSVEQTPWTAYRKQTCTSTYGCVTSWRQLYYDDAASLKLRYDLVNKSDLRGVGIWALGFDGTRPELRTALADKFLADTTAPVVGVATFAQQQRDEGFRVAWKSWDDSTVTGYDVQVSVDGGAWAAWLTGTTLTSSIYLGTDGRTYAFRVRARDVHGNVAAWNSATNLGKIAAPASIEVGGFATVLVDGLKMRASASTGGSIMTYLSDGDALQVIGGPVTGDGYTWYQVAGPVRQWGPVDAMQIGGWIAASGNGATNAGPRRPVYATKVNAGITGFNLNGGGARVLSPNGDGTQDELRLSWTNQRSFDSLALRVFRLDGTVAGTVSLGGVGSGNRTYDWDGRVGGVKVPAGTYVLQLQGMDGGHAFSAPSASPVSGPQIERTGVIVADAAPTAVLDIDGPTSPNKAATLTWHYTFGGAVKWLSAADFVRTGTATGCVIGNPVGSDATWSVSVAGCSGGTITLGLKADTVADAVGNWGPASQVNAPGVLIDRRKPVAAAPKVTLRTGASLASASKATGLLASLVLAGTDPGGAGIRSYDVKRSLDGGSYTWFATNVTSSSMAMSLTPKHSYRFKVRARDWAGNVGSWVAGATIRAYLRQQTNKAMRWKGTWRLGTSSSYSAGSDRFATAAGAAMTYSFTGRAIGWVTTLGPGRGTAKVYLDGKLMATIDTHAASVVFRRVAFTKTWASSGYHTIRIVVVGTAGHPRVDVDALEILR
ncbi:MAG TPA: glycosyl hydrolase family 18 protein [Candidatus Limnocylindria bacterium]|nr:glycosyl hydrolase family 18 protein [Candidatus Limnocylindria bacterium]